MDLGEVEEVKDEMVDGFELELRSEETRGEEGRAEPLLGIDF